MKIAVCFKALPDLDRLSASDWVWDEHHEVDTSFVRRIFNCYEESALEAALKLYPPIPPAPSALPTSAPASVCQTELTALTVDDQAGDIFLRHLMAVGYDRAVRIRRDPAIDLRFNPAAIARLIAAFLKREGYHLVLMGRQGGEGDNRQTGPLVAERLGWPCIGEVADVERTESPDQIQVTNHGDSAVRVQVVQLPLVLVMGQSSTAPYLRVPTLKQKLAAKKQRIAVISAAELGGDNAGLSGNDKTLLELIRPHSKRTCRFIAGDNARQQAQQLFDQHLKARLQQ